MAQKKYVSLSRLSTFLENLKGTFSALGHKHTVSDLTDYKVDDVLSSTSTNPVQNKILDAEFEAISEGMNALELAIDSKADASHNHNDLYYTESEINTKLSGKANTTHSHVISDITDLKTALDGKAASSHGTHVSYSTTAPVMDGTASVGTATTVARSDHKHPTDTSRASKTEFDSHNSDTTKHITSTERTNWNAAKTHADSAHARTDATKVEDSTTNGNIKINGTETNVYSHPNSGVTASTYKSVTVNAQGHVTGGSNPTTLAGYGITDAEAKGTASSAVSTHNTSADAHGDIRLLITELTTKLNNFLDVDDTTTDQLSELLTLINDNAVDIVEITSGKVNVSDIVNNLTTNVTNKPLSAAQGVAIKSLIDALDLALDTHDGNTTKHITSTERTNWNTAYTHSQAAHAPSNAQPNQNAFSNIKVGSTTIAADTTTDTLTLEGTNVTITPDTTNDKVTIAVADGTTSAKGVVQLTDSVTSTSTTTAATPKNVKAAYDLANTAKQRADSAYTLAEGKVDSLSDLGVTATAAELNYMGGVTSSVQTQLDAISNELDNHSHSEYAKSTHNHSASNIISGILAVERGGTGNMEGYVRAGALSGSTIGALATAEGRNTTASGSYCHAEGNYTEATGSSSHAEGQNTTASGIASHAEGENTTASGSYSHAEGENTIASSKHQHVQGKFNKEDSTGTYAHILGNGTGASSSSRSNAHTIDWNGNGWFAGDIYVGGTSQNDTAASKVITEADQEWTLIYDSGEIPEIANSISGINVSGYTNFEIVVRCYNDGDSYDSRSGAAIFTAQNGKTYQFPVWTSMFSKSINTVSTMAHFKVVDGWLVCPYASRAIADIDVFETSEGGTSGNFALTGSGMLRCTSPLSTLTISSQNQSANHYFGSGSRVMVWGWNA